MFELFENFIVITIALLLLFVLFFGLYMLFLSTRVYVLYKLDDFSFVAVFGDENEVISYFWSLCDTTKELLKVPMYKTKSFRAAKVYLKTLGYGVMLCRSGGVNGKFNR